MLGGDDEDLPRTAVNKLCSLRLKGPSYPIEDNNFEGRFIEPRTVLTECTAIRKFLYQKSTLEQSFHKMVNLNPPDIHEPPVTKQFNYEAINVRCSKDGQPLKLDHPCYNQAVERHVKLVTKASASAAGHERLDGMIRHRIQSRKLMKFFETKKQFNV